MAVLDWADVPVEDRLTREVILSCRGADPAFNPGWELWIKKRLHSITDEPGMCFAVTAYFGEGLKGRCVFATQPGERYCSKHGGAKRPPVTSRRWSCVICGRSVTAQARLCPACKRQFDDFEAIYGQRGKK